MCAKIGEEVFMKNTTKHSVPQGLCACMMLVFAASFMPWGLGFVTSQSLIGSPLNDFPSFGIEQVPAVITGWNGEIALGPFFLPNVLVVFAAATSAALGYFRLQRFRRWKREICWTIIAYGLLHMLCLTRQCREFFPGAVLAIFGLVGMAMSILMFQPQREHELNYAVEDEENLDEENLDENHTEGATTSTRSECPARSRTASAKTTNKLFTHARRALFAKLTRA